MLSLVGEYLDEVCFLLGFTANLCRAAVLSKSSPEMSSNDESILAFLKEKYDKHQVSGTPILQYRKKYIKQIMVILSHPDIRKI